MNIVDSSGWLEYFAGSLNAGNFAKAIENTKELIVPAVIVQEVFRKILTERDEDTALQVVAHMKQGKIVDLDLDLALSAAKLGKKLKLPMADSMIMAVAMKYEATIWTQDADFKGLQNVKYFEKRT